MLLFCVIIILDSGLFVTNHYKPLPVIHNGSNTKVDKVIAKSIKQLLNKGVKVIGAVLNNLEVVKARGYYYDYKGYKGYGYSYTGKEGASEK